MRRWIFRIILGAISGLILVLLIRAWLPQPLGVDTAQVQEGPFAATLEYTGKTRVKHRYTLYAPAAGTLSRIALQTGDVVTPETFVAWLRPMLAAPLDARTFSQTQERLSALQDAQRQAHSQERSALDSLKEAQKEFDRTRTLFRNKASTLQEMERAQFQLQRAQANYASAQFSSQISRHELESTERLLRPQKQSGAEQSFALNAPIRGTVLRILQPNEGPVVAGTPLLEMGSMEFLEVVVEAQTQDAVVLRRGMKARIEEWGADGILEAQIDRVEPSAFTDVSPLGVEEQRVNIILNFAAGQTPPVALGDGYELRVHFILWEGEKAIHVPTSSVVRKNEHWMVFVVANEKVEERIVEIGHRSDSHIELLKGVSRGETVILHPSENVKAQVSVRIR